MYHPFRVIDGAELSERRAPRELQPNESEGLSLPGRWVNSHELQAGDVVLSQDGQELPVLKLEQEYQELFPVSNLTIEQDQNFAVGPNAVLVHNTGGCSKTRSTERPPRKNGAAQKSVAELNREASLARGIPESQLGPSGLPKIHTPKHSSVKQAREAARRRVGRGGTTVKHPRPRVGAPHFHGVTIDGIKIRIHDAFPKVN